MWWRGAVAFLWLGIVQPVPAAELWVAPDGRDTAPGTAAAPLATLAQAQARVRQVRAANRSEAVTVTLRQGTYRLAAPLTFTPLDGGTAAAPVTWRAAPGERVVLSGGVPVTGWQQVDEHLWAAPVPWVKERPEPFTQLFVNGQRRPRARTPNAGSYFYSQRLRLSGLNSGAPICTGLIGRPGDLGPWVAEPGAEICLFHNWVNSYNRVAEANLDRRALRFTRPAGIFFLGPSVRYYVENVRAALDAPGEWFVDRAAGRLLYYPLPGEDPPRAEVIAPRLTATLVRLQGEPDLGLPVEYLNFSGLSYQHTDANLAADYEHSVQGANTQRGAIVAVGARHCRIEDCEFTRLGEHGLSLLQSCTDNVVVRCHFHDLGGGGVYLSAGSPASQADSYLTARNVVDSNLIHDGGLVFRAGCGVFLGGSASYNRITHNEICDLSWIGIHLGWSWTGREPAFTHHNEVGYNHIHHLGNGVLNDIGGIYTLGVSPGTVLHHNLIHDITRYQRGELGYGGWGIYLDAGSSGIVVENNIVYHTRDGGLHLHCYGHPSGDVIRNNIFAAAEAGQLMRNADHEPVGNHAHLERNIVCNALPALLWGSNWAPQSHFTADHNLYWTTAATPPDFNGSTFAQWQATGRDTHSVVADPLFVDAAAHDYRLRPDSPALRLGFEPIDLSTVGLQGPPAWRARPQALAHRLVETAPPPEAEGPRQVYDFEEYEVGDTPDHAVPPDGATSVRVCDRDPATGQRCLRFVDGPAGDVWKPHWYLRHTPRPGPLRLRCDVRQDPVHPVTFDLEFRDWPAMAGAKFATGPLLRFLADGTAQAADGAVWHRLGRVVPGQWVTVTIDLREGPDQPQTYTVGVGDLPVSPALRFRQATYAHTTWIGFAGMAAEPGEFFVGQVVVE